MEMDEIDPHWHIPNAEEVDWACEFVQRFISAELNLLREKCSMIGKEERLRSLQMIFRLTIGSLRMFPPMSSPPVANLYVPPPLDQRVNIDSSQSSTSRVVRSDGTD